jgi:hypothetical protein
MLHSRDIYRNTENTGFDHAVTLQSQALDPFSITLALN